MKYRNSGGGLMQRISWFMDKLLAVLGGLLILCVLLNFANVVARYIFNTALFGIEELQIYLMVGIAFLGAVVVSWRREHLRMDAVVGYFGARARRGISAAEHLALAVLLGFAAVQSGRYTWQMAQIGRKSDLMEIPMWIPHGSVSLGLALMALIAAYRLLVPRSLAGSAPATEAPGLRAHEVPR